MKLRDLGGRGDQKTRLDNPPVTEGQLGRVLDPTQGPVVVALHQNAQSKGTDKRIIAELGRRLGPT